MKNNTQLSKKGFTLIEIMVVVVIIAVLTVVGMVSYGSINKNSRDAKRKSDLEQIRSALEMYRTDNGYYPSAGTGTWTNVSNLSSALVTGQYMPAIPEDPATSTSSYRYNATLLQSSNYYGYCLEAVMENSTLGVNQCVGENGYNYTIKNP